MFTVPPKRERSESFGSYEDEEEEEEQEDDQIDHEHDVEGEGEGDLESDDGDSVEPTSYRAPSHRHYPSQYDQSTSRE